MNKLSLLEQIHEKHIQCLIFSQKQDSLISASEDKSICCWMKIDENKWHPSQLYQKHKGAITSMILIANEKQLISGSTDQSLIVWDVDFNKNIIQFKYQLQPSSGDVVGLTINSQQNILASSHLNKSIIICKKEKMINGRNLIELHKYHKYHRLNLDQEFFFTKTRISFGWSAKVQEINGKFVENQKLQVLLSQNSQETDFYLFPIIQNLQNNILIIKQKKKIYIIKQTLEETLKIAGIIKCKSNRISGCLQNDGSHLFFWDPNGKDTARGQYFIYKI